MLATKTRKRIDLTTVFVHILLALLALVILVPFYWMIISSTLDLPQIVQFPPRLWPGDRLVVNFRQLLEILPFGRAFANSLLISVVATTSQLFFCSLSGYAFAKYKFPGRDRLFILLLATMMIPSAVNLVPWFIMMNFFGWIDSYKALIIPGMASAFGIFWMRQYVSQSVPDEMLQAARIDGCSDFGIYARVVLPVVLPGLGALGIINFMGVWNDYLGPLIILRSLQKFTLPLVVALMANQFNNRLHLMMMGSSFATVPVLIVFFLASNKFISGLTAGSIKE
jgi:ABC-type glycerol-3-phosphate transport system permease component